MKLYASGRLAPLLINVHVKVAVCNQALSRGQIPILIFPSKHGLKLPQQWSANVKVSSLTVAVASSFCAILSLVFVCVPRILWSRARLIYKSTNFSSKFHRGSRKWNSLLWPKDTIRPMRMLPYIRYAATNLSRYFQVGEKIDQCAFLHLFSTAGVMYVKNIFEILLVSWISSRNKHAWTPL